MVVEDGDELALLIDHDPPVMMDRAPPAKLEKEPYTSSAAAARATDVPVIGTTFLFLRSRMLLTHVSRASISFLSSAGSGTGARAAAALS
jgi:hypothetical protein